MKTILFIIAILIIVSIGTIKSSEKNKMNSEMKNKNDVKGKVTGVGGIFFKSKDPDKIKDWYNQNLGLATNEYGSLFEFRKADQPDEKAYLQWSPFTEKTKYFEPSQKEFMINYRVENIEALVDELKKMEFR